MTHTPADIQCYLAILVKESIPEKQLTEMVKTIRVIISMLDAVQLNLDQMRIEVECDKWSNMKDIEHDQCQNRLFATYVYNAISAFIRASKNEPANLGYHINAIRVFAKTMPMKYVFTLPPSYQSMNFV